MEWGKEANIYRVLYNFLSMFNKLFHNTFIRTIKYTLLPLSKKCCKLESKKLKSLPKSK